MSIAYDISVQGTRKVTAKDRRRSLHLLVQNSPESAKILLDLIVPMCEKPGCMHFKVGTKYCRAHGQRDRHTGKGRKTNKIKGLK